MLIINPANGEILQTDDPTAYYGMGYRDATPEELDHSARVEEFGSFEQQAQAQAERVVRGATLGAVEGFGGDPEAIRARADVSRELSPITSLAADVLPDVGVAALTGGLGGLATGAGRAAARASLAEGAGLLRAGLAAGRAGGAAALAGESLGTGAVGAGQAAYAEGRSLGDDPGADAENALIWGGLNFGLGSFMMRRGAKAADDILEEGGELGAKELDDVAAAAEVRAAAKGLPEEAIPGTPGQIFDVEGMSPEAQGALERSQARASQGGSVAVGSGQASPGGLIPTKTKTPIPEGHVRVYADTDGWLWRTTEGDPSVPKREQATVGKLRKATEEELDFIYRSRRDHFDIPDPSAGRAPLNDVRIPDQEGMLDEVIPPDDPRLAALQPELDKLRSEGIAGLSLKDLRALPLEEGPGAAESAAKVAAFEADETFLREGMLPSNNDRGRGGLPAISLFPGEPPALSNGRHRVTAARKAGREEITMNVKAYDADGNTLWDYVGPVRVSPPRGGNIGARAGERGTVDLAGLASSPMGNVIAAGAGAALGGALGGDPGSIAAGGVLGFAASALGGRFGRAAARGGRKLEAAAVRQGEREAVEGGVERALRNASKSDAADVVERAIGTEPVKEADSFGRQRRLYINRKAIRQVAGAEMQKDLTELVENVRQVASVEKQAAVASHVSDNLTAQRAVAKGVAKQAAEFAGQLRAEAKAYAGAAGEKGLKYAIPGQRDLAVDLMDHSKKLAQATDGKGLYQALDDFKRAAQEHKISLEGGRLNDTSSIHYDNLIPRVEAFANQLRQSLEDPSTWGRAGEMQRAYNSVISDRLLPHMKTFESAVLQRTHKGYDGLWKLEGWERKIDALLKGTDAGNRRHVVAMLDAMGELADVQRKFGTAKQADAIAGQVSKVRRTLGLADELADAEERMHALGQIIGGGPLGGFLAGGLAGGLPGAVIGGAIPGAVRGLVMGDLIEAFQRLSGATDQAVQRGVDDWIRSSRVRAGGIRERLPKLPNLSDEGKQLRDVAMRRGITQSMALFMGEDSTPHAAYKRLQDKLLDGEAFFADLSKEYGTLQKEAPEVFMMLAARADGDRRFLLQRMPPNVAVSMANPDGYPPSRDSIEDWATYVNAIRYPMRVARSIGSMRVQEAEALRERRPRVYELLQQRVIEGIQTAKRSGEQVDDVALAKINLLFPEVDGLASPVFSRELGQVVSDYNLAKRERERGGGSPSAPPDKRGQLPAQAMAQQGATFGMQG